MISWFWFITLYKSIKNGVQIIVNNKYRRPKSLIDQSEKTARQRAATFAKHAATARRIQTARVV